MRTAKKPAFSRKPLFAAMIFALSAPAAFAALPTPTQVPGQGAIIYNNASIAVAAGTASTPITQEWNLTATSTAPSGSVVVIQWGGNSTSTLNTAGTAGFDIGTSAGVEFSGAPNVNYASVLNIDASGNPSTILGQFSAAGSVGSLFVANANGIVVGSSAVINAPGGLGLINANLTGISSGAFATLQSQGILPIDFQGVSGGISIASGANLSGIGPYGYLLVAGAGAVNVSGTLPTDTSVIVDGGVGGGFSATVGSAGVVATFTPQDKGTAQSLSSLDASNYTTFSYQDAPTTVSVNLGTGSTANIGNATMFADGDLNNQGNLYVLSGGTINLNATGTITNTSGISAATLDINTNTIYGNTSSAQNGAFTNTGSGAIININGGSGNAYLIAYGTSFSNLSGASISVSALGGYTAKLGFDGNGAFLNSSGSTIDITNGDLTANGTAFTNLGALNFSGSDDHAFIGASQRSINLNGTISAAGLSYLGLFASSVGQSININTALALNNTASIRAGATNINIEAPVSAGTFVYFPIASTTGTANATPLANNFTVTSQGSISAGTIDVGFLSTTNPEVDYGNLHGTYLASVPGYQSLTNLDINGPLLAGTAGTVNFGQAVQGYNGNTYSSAIDVVSGSSFITAATIAFNNLLSPPHPVNQITFTPSGHYFPITTQPTSSVSQATNLPGNGEVIYTDPLSVVFNTSTIYQNPSQVPGLGTSSTGATINISGQTNVTPGTPSPLIIDWGVPASYSTLNPGTASGFDIGTGAVLSFVNDATYAGGTPAAVDVLNIDVSGYPSNLYGTLDYQGNGGSLWVANGNGILVGSSATLTAPGGLGLIAPGGIQNITAPNVYNLMTSFVTGTMGLDFNDTNATGGVVSIARGADLSGVQQFLDVAGYNSVNVDAPGLANTVALSVDGGIGAHVNTATGAMVPYDDSSVSGYLTDAPTNVRLDVGTGTSAGTAYSNAGALFLADGNLTNLGNLSVNETQVDWINGTFSNDGALQMTPVGNQGYAVLGFNTGTTAYIPSGLTPNTQTVYGNASSAAPTGDFVNAGVLNATTATEGFGFFGAGFQNDAGATLNVSGSAYIGTTNDGVTLAGSMSPLSGSLAVVALGANSVINVQSPISAATGVLLAANTVNISSVIDPLGSFTFFGPESGAAQMNLAAGGSIDAGDVYLGTEGSASITNFVLNGTINGSNSVLFGSGSTPTGHVKGAGSITTPSLTFANLQGSVHNIVSPVIALNGFQVNAENPASTSPALNTVNLSVSADGNGEQGVNLKVNGNLAIDSGNTQAIDAGGAAPANANSILYVQATGNVQVNAGTGANNYGSIAVPNTTDGLFQFPGLVYLQAGNGGGGDSPSDILMVGSPTNPVVIANAFSPSAQVGREGVFLIAPTINYWANSLYTNGNAGVVFAAPYDGLGFPSAAINGNAPTATSYVTDYMPTVYFMRSVPTAAYGEELLPSDVFTNDNGQLQEMQTFLNLY
ncbi:beta strand repeat-containing protein [Acidithiobacillus sulfuriphilus]|uniref:Uncharacterized protein n=2 Tax=Acidithiobacillus sulfuriphilus TaxID=1867749 RepID=A0ACD5HTJ2_9PROT